MTKLNFFDGPALTDGACGSDQSDEAAKLTVARVEAEPDRTIRTRYASPGMCLVNAKASLV